MLKSDHRGLRNSKVKFMWVVGGWWVVGGGGINDCSDSLDFLKSDLVNNC